MVLDLRLTKGWDSAESLFLCPLVWRLWPNGLLKVERKARNITMFGRWMGLEVAVEVWRLGGVLPFGNLWRVFS